MIGIPSIFKLIRKAAALARVLPTFPFNCVETTTEKEVEKFLRLSTGGRGQFPDESVRITV